MNLYWYIIVNYHPYFIYGILFVDLDKCLMPCIYHYNIIWNSFTAPKVLCLLPIHQSLATTGLLTVFSFAFSRMEKLLFIDFFFKLLLECYLKKRDHFISSFLIWVPFFFSLYYCTSKNFHYNIEYKFSWHLALFLILGEKYSIFFVLKYVSYRFLCRCPFFIEKAPLYS